LNLQLSQGSVASDVVFEDCRCRPRGQKSWSWSWSWPR